MKKLLSCFVLAATVYQLQATVVLYEPFNYSPAGSQLSAAATPNWTKITAVSSVEPKVSSGSLSYPGLQTDSSGNSVAFDGIAPAAGVSLRSLGSTYDINNASTMYYSLTFKVSSVADNPVNEWGGSANYSSGSYMLGFDQQTAGTAVAGDAAAPLLIRTGDPSNASTNGTYGANNFEGFQLGTGVTATTGANRIFDATHTYNVGDTLFVVLSYTFGAGASDDRAKLYVNPIPGSLEGDNTPVVNTTGFTDVTGNKISGFFLRNNSVEPETSIVDDLRVGTTWADVTPAAVPEPSMFAFVGLGLGAFFLRRFRK